MMSSWALAAALLSSAYVHSDAAGALTVMFLPLDERFTTRDAWLNLAKVTPHRVITPPVELLSHQKDSANATMLHDWMLDNLLGCDVLVCSSELYLYGGLIASRQSNDSQHLIMARLDSLAAVKTKYHDLHIYMSSVVMRIPSYNEDVEEPWYWAFYGADLYGYSFFLDRYDQLHNASDLAQAEAYEAKVPANIVSEFLWRRSRNFNVTMRMVQLQSTTKLFENLYITLDDNAPYGLNIAEANRLRQAVASLELQSTVFIYPGADEVGLTMLSKMCVDFEHGNSSPVPVTCIYRDPTATSRIPAYEGQPMDLTVRQQLQAAGAVFQNSTTTGENDIWMLINNFSEETQVEADAQPSRPASDFDVFEPYITTAVENKSIVLGFADNRYCNGGDIALVSWMTGLASSQSLNITAFAYAGWNTDGNTLGTVFANSVLLSLYGRTATNTVSSLPNAYFNFLRINEDLHYQALVRTDLNNYIYKVSPDSVTNLVPDLQFYQRYTFKRLASDMAATSALYGMAFTLDSVYYPWNRTFEIGLLPSVVGASLGV